MAAAFRVFVEIADAALARRARDEAAAAGWTIVTRAEDADLVLRAVAVAPPAATAPVRLDAAPTTPPRWDDDGTSPIEALTPRELDVLRLLAEGAGNRAIGERLGISDHTVKFHLSAIFGKLGVTTRTAAVRRAMRLGWIDA